MFYSFFDAIHRIAKHAERMKNYLSNNGEMNENVAAKFGSRGCISLILRPAENNAMIAIKDMIVIHVGMGVDPVIMRKRIVNHDNNSDLEAKTIFVT